MLIIAKFKFEYKNAQSQPSHFPYSYARLAQSVEHQTFNLRVAGSSPSSGGEFYINFEFFVFLYWCKTLPRVRIELTTFRLWDWRAAYCANKAHRFRDSLRRSSLRIRKTLKTRKRCQINQISMEFSRTRSRYAKNAASANQPRRIVNFFVNSETKKQNCLWIPCRTH